MSTAFSRPWCGRLGLADVGRDLEVVGWARRPRDKGGIVFVEMRDRTGAVQLVFEAEQLELGREISAEDAIRVRGVVRERERPNAEMATGAIEIAATELEIVGPAETPPFTITDDTTAAEELRLEHRVLDLRRPVLQRHLQLRHEVVLEARRFFDEMGFVEIETPILTRSTPEGARDFLVPSRLNRGEFYALPQSPQLFKQLLQVAGYGRYMQIARCFRDEDLRADRQPEFSQIDVEASFVDEEDILFLIEKLFARLFPLAGITPPEVYERIPYREAMERWGSDRPDRRFGLELVDLAEVSAGCGFVVLEGALAEGGRVKGLVLPGGASLSRKQLDALNAVVQPFGARGVLWSKRQAGGDWASPAKKALGEDGLARFAEAAGQAEGDLLLMLAGAEKMVLAGLGALRLYLAREHALIPEGVHDFCWVTEFPLLEWDQDEERFFSVHHPFTAPFAEDLPLLASDPRAVRSRAYDVVMDGVELGGGSIRIHRTEEQRSVFEALGIDLEEAGAKFGFLLEALKYGAPPHGGVALGLDRMIMLMAGAASIRDVIAFPKTTSGTCLLTQAPSAVDDGQLAELGLRLRD